MKLRALIVDDSITVRMDLGEAFEAAGFEPILCSDLSGAREALARGDCALVVLDVLLPDGDGLELLQELRGTPRTSHTPVLLLTTEREVKSRVRGMNVGADEYVGKPYDINHVVARARSLAGARAAAAEPRRRVLLIDDSPTFRAELRGTLEHAGYEVREAATGEEGLSTAAAIRPDAVVVDGVLPGIDGLTVVRRLKSDVALRGTPCLLLTAAEGGQDELSSLEAGADAYARKSEDPVVILVRLAALLRSVSGTQANVGASLFGPKRLLAVDDSPTYLEELGEQLRHEGYDVVLAKSGEEALELLAVQTVDCILLDLMMPGLSGQDTCRLIKLRPEWRDIPLVMLTGRDDRDAMIEGINAGADDYIAKGADFEVLKARLRAQLRRKHFEDENRRVREHAVRKETEARFQRLIHSNIIGVILAHLDGRITDANDAFLAMLGYSRAELEAGVLRWTEITAPEWCARDEAAVAQLKGTGAAATYESEYLRKDGTRLPTLVGLVLLEDADTVVGFVLDRTEQKHAAEVLRRNAVEIEAAYRALQEAQATLVQSAKMASLGELVAGVAHELNNPVAFVRSHVDTTRRCLSQVRDEMNAVMSDRARTSLVRAETRLHEMAVGLERIAELVVKLRTFSRLDEGELKTVSIRECIESVLTILGHRWKNRVQIDVQLGEPDQLECFPALLNQALLNLISNALDALADEGSITISSGMDRDAYAITVDDTGHGIPNELRDRVFEPFFTTKPVGQGTGLGLSITYSIVRKHGGTLELRDRVGGGTKAIVRLPLHPELER